MSRSDGARARGFTLIEVLVAAVVLAIGLLGLAGLQPAISRNNHTAYLRSQATHLASAMADRMRANMQGVLGESYHNKSQTTDDCDDESDDDSAGKICGAAEMAGYDLADWNTALASQLPDGKGIVCRDGTPDDGTAASPACDGAGAVYVIKVWWNEKVPGYSGPGAKAGEGASTAGTITRRFVTSLQP